MSHGQAAFHIQRMRWAGTTHHAHHLPQPLLFVCMAPLSNLTNGKIAGYKDLLTCSITHLWASTVNGLETDRLFQGMLGRFMT